MIFHRGFIQVPILITLLVSALVGVAAYVAYVENKQLGVPLEMVDDKSQSTTTVASPAEIVPRSQFEIEQLKKQVQELTMQVSKSKTTDSPKTSIVTLQSGAVVEMDAIGNVVRILVPAPQVYIPPSVSTNNQNQQPLPVAVPAATISDTVAPTIVAIKSTISSGNPVTWKNGNLTGSLNSSCSYCVYIESNEPVKVLFKYQTLPSSVASDGALEALEGNGTYYIQSINTLATGVARRHVIRYDPIGQIDDQVLTSNIANKALITDLILDRSKVYYWIVEIIDEAGNVRQQDFVYPHTWTTGQLLPKI